MKLEQTRLSCHRRSGLSELEQSASCPNQDATEVELSRTIPQPQRLKKLNEIAIQQMRILSEVEGRKYLK